MPIDVSAVADMREAAAQKLRFMRDCLHDGIAKAQLDVAASVVAALPLPEANPDPCDAALAKALVIVKEALEFYARHGAGCRKLSNLGEPSRHALDRDGGNLALGALITINAAAFAAAMEGK